MPTLPGEGLPTAADLLCRRLHRAITLPEGVGRPTVLAWRPGGELLTTDGDGQVARWTIGGEAQVLAADEERHAIVVAPDGSRVLRYGSGTDGQLWRLGPRLAGCRMVRWRAVNWPLQAGLTMVSWLRLQMARLP